MWPSSTTECWDVSSKASLTHDGGGDSNAIANMIKYAVATYQIDPMKVFVTGGSSGGEFDFPPLVSILVSEYEYVGLGTVWFALRARYWTCGEKQKNHCKKEREETRREPTAPTQYLHPKKAQL